MQFLQREKLQDLSIALIEDDLVDYHWIGGLLKRIPELTCNCTWAKSFEEGEALLNDKPYDIAFVDHAIGAHSGLDIVRLFGGRKSQTPMVMLTGASNRELDLEALDAGVYDFLEKGAIGSNELERTIRYTLKTRQLEKELRDAKEIAEKANKAKSNFLSHLSHDLKTPLNAIVGFAELIAMKKTAHDTSKKYAGQIYSSGRHLSDMIEDLLTLSYLDAQKEEYSPSHYSIKTLFEEAIKLTNYCALEKNIRIRASFATNDVMIYGDKKALRRILVNLIGVAIKHSRQGGSIYLSSASDTLGTSILLSDDGDGITQTTIEEALKAGPYNQDAYTTTSNGIGLSLSIVSQYVKMHNARMLLESEEAGGTLIKLFFPNKSEPQHLS